MSRGFKFSCSLANIASYCKEWRRQCCFYQKCDSELVCVRACGAGVTLSNDVDKPNHDTSTAAPTTEPVTSGTTVSPPSDIWTTSYKNRTLCILLSANITLTYNSSSSKEVITGCSSLVLLHFIVTALQSGRLTPSMPAVPNCCCSKGPAPYWSHQPFFTA